MWGQRPRAPVFNNPQNFQQNYRPQNFFNPKFNPRVQGNYQPYHPPKEDQKIYICPGCLQNYEYLFRNNTYLGRVPLILKCSHTVCQECINRQCHTTQIVCHTCKKESSVGRKHLENLQEIFPPNFYILGFMMWHRNQNPAKSVNFVPTQMTMKTRQANPVVNNVLVNQNLEHCCFDTCSKVAEFHCKDCNDNYCADCNETIHNKSAKSMRRHKFTPIAEQKLKFELEKCTIHENVKEFYCIPCDQEICVYCLIDQHEGHEKSNLTVLSVEDTLQLEEMQNKAKKVFGQLRKTQKKLAELKSGNTDGAERQIRSYFANLHGELYCVEKKLIEEIAELKNDNGSVEDLSRKIQTSMQNVEQVLSVLELKNLNKMVLMNALKDVNKIPRFLISENGGDFDAIKFKVEPSFEPVENKFSVEKLERSISLVTEDELPEDYEIDCSEDDLSVISKTVERVTVTHVNSLESFYVQHHKFQTQFTQMENDIKSHIAKDARPVISPEINEAYLGLVKDSYLRGRVLNILNDEKCEFYLVDRGTTEVIEVNKLREMTPSLAQRKPFAFEYQLHNPSFVNWSKDAHLHFARLINNKEVQMMIKNPEYTIPEVDIMISSSTGQLTSVTDLLIHSCDNVLSSSEEVSSIVSAPPEVNFTYSQNMKLYPNSVKFHANKSLEVLIVHINSPHDLYVQEYSNYEAVLKLTREMDKHYKKANASCVPVENTYVVVKYKNQNVSGVYHRAFVKNVNVMKDLVKVFLVDWGVKTLVAIEDVKMLTESFTRLECQAIQVKMAHIEPYNMDNDWAPSAIDYLNVFLMKNQQLKMTVNGTDPLEVVLFEENGAVDYCINAQMVSERLAESTGKLSSVVEWPQITANVPSKNEDVSLIGNMLNNVTLDEDDDDETEKMVGLPKMIEIAKFVSPDLIFIRLADSREKHEQLFKDMQIHYNSPKERIPVKTCSVNDKCVIYYIKQNAYFRGKIEEVLDNDKFKIYLVDSAETEIVPKGNIFKYHEYFNKYLPAANKAYLADIKPAGDTGKWSTSAIDALRQTLKDNRELYVTKAGKLSDDHFFPVVMWYKNVIPGQGALDPSYIKYVSINSILVKLGFAYKVKNGETVIPEPVKKEPVETKTEDDIIPKEENSPYHKCELPSADWTPAFKLLKHKFRALITYADDSTGYLYLHDEDYQIAYENLEADIKEYFDNHPITRKTEPWSAGQICTISYDEKWYRGKVTQVINSNKIEVFMIDFGSVHCVCPDDLYVEILFPDIPAFATKVQLYNVHPKCGKWLTSDHDILMDMIKEFADVEIHGDIDADVPEVEIFFDNGICLNKALVTKSNNLVEAHSFKSDSTDDDDEPILIVEDIEEVIEKPQLNEYVLSEIPQSELTKMSIMNVINYNTLILNHASQSPECYYDLLEKISNEMQEQAHLQPPLKNVALEQSCVCPYSEDDKWYRAKIHNLEGQDYGVVSVLFVDYGNIESVSSSDLREMKPEWFELPVHNHIAKLDFELCVKQQADLVTTQIKKLNNKTKMVKIVNINPLVVRLLEDGGSFSYQNLIDKGLIKAN